MRIQAIVRTYIKNIRPLSQDELDWFRQQPTMRSAIELAALAINRRGKRYSHQRRLKKAILEQACQVLLSNEKSLKEMGSYADLIALITELIGPIKGLGELYLYDTALRIGAKLDLFPTKIYLHTGTRRGAKALGLNHRANTLEISELPLEIRQLEPHEIEDVLCIFKDNFAILENNILAVELLKRSWCS